MYPEITIEDQQINSMHAALERARAVILQQSKRMDVTSFRVSLGTPQIERPSAGEETVQPAYYCYANLTIKTRITV